MSLFLPSFWSPVHEIPRYRRGRPQRRIRRGLQALPCAIAIFASLSGCAGYEQRPEINPDAVAPPKAAREWAPPGQAVTFDLASESGAAAQPAAQRGKMYSLPDLIDLALNSNPETRRTWEAARAAAAEFGEAQGPYYPFLSLDSESGYRRFADLVPKHWGVQKSWQSRDLLAVNYLLLDFGRRNAASRSAQEQLLAANFLFNQKVQEVVFAVERAFYTLDAAKASVRAAEAIVTMARTDRIAARKRLAVGLATKPQVLLSVQREAQAGAVNPTLADLVQPPYSPRLGQGVCDLRQACGVGDMSKTVAFLSKANSCFARLAGYVVVTV